MTDPIVATSAALAAYNHASNIIKSLFELKVDNSITERLNDLLKELNAIHLNNTEMQQKLSSAYTEITNLKKELTRLEEWDYQKSRYKLMSPWPSAVVYAATKADSNGEPPNWICAQCYGSHKRSFLYPRKNKFGCEEFFCNCGAVVPSNHRGSHTIKYFEEYQNV